MTNLQSNYFLCPLFFTVQADRITIIAAPAITMMGIHTGDLVCCSSGGCEGSADEEGCSVSGGTLEEGEIEGEGDSFKGVIDTVGVGGAAVGVCVCVGVGTSGELETVGVAVGVAEGEAVVVAVAVSPGRRGRLTLQQ